MAPFIHPNALVEDNATVGEGTRVWHYAHIRSGATVGSECIISKGVYIEGGVVIGNRVKIQNFVSVYEGVEIEDGVFVGPNACFTNDHYPRAITPDGKLKGLQDWTISKTLVRYGAALGANSTIVCGITIGKWALVGSGSVVTHDVPDYGLVLGSPARLRGFVGPHGRPLTDPRPTGDGAVEMTCPVCGERIRIPEETYAQCHQPIIS